MREKAITTPAIVTADQASTASILTNDQFEREAKYQETMIFFSGMLKNGILTKEQYAEIETKMLDKYHPMFGTIFAQSRLTL